MVYKENIGEILCHIQLCSMPDTADVIPVQSIRDGRVCESWCEGETESYRASEDKDAGSVGGSGIYQLGCGQ